MLIACSSKKICTYYIYVLISGIVIIMYTCYLLNPNYGKSIWQRCCEPDLECYWRS